MKKLSPKQIKMIKVLACLFLASILIFIYFSFFTVITSDSTNYYHYLEIIKGNLPLSNWRPTRGPTFPVIISLITILFGDTSLGFIAGTFIFFLSMIGLSFFIIRKLSEIQKSGAIKVVMWILFIFLMIFNPLIIGYYHTMLTEFVATTFALLSCFLSIKWISIDIKKERLKFVIFSVAFILLSIVMWFLKQPYVIVSLIPLILGTVISIFKIKNIFNSFLKSIVVVLCLLFTGISIFTWDKILAINGANLATTRTEGFLTEGLIRAVSNFRVVDYEKSHDKKLIENFAYLDESEKDNITDIINKKTKYNDYNLYEVHSIFQNNIIDVVVIPDITPEKTSLRDVAIFLKVSITRHPGEALTSYIYNYFSLINLTPYNYETFIPRKRILKQYELHGEIESIGLSIYRDKSTFRGSANKRLGYMPQYKLANPNDLSTFSSSFSIKLVRAFFLISLTGVLFISPFLFIFFAIRYFLKKKFITKEKILLYETLIVFFGYSFLHVAFHAITGAIVDRYSFVAYPTAVLASLLLLNFFSIKKLHLIFNKIFKRKLRNGNK